MHEISVGIAILLICAQMVLLVDQKYVPFCECQRKVVDLTRTHRDILGFNPSTKRSITFESCEGRIFFVEKHLVETAW